jgi:hypothetical protein
MRLLTLAIVLAGCGAASPATAPIAQADPSQWKPAGWKAEQSSYTDNWTFTSPDGLKEAQVGLYENDPARVADMLSGHMKPYGTDEIKKSPPKQMPDGVWMSAGGYIHDDNGTKYLAASVVVPHKLGGAFGCYASAPMLNGGADPVVGDILQKCTSAAQNGEAFDAEHARRAAQRQAVAGTLKPGKGRPVEAVLLNEYYISGVGGGIYPDYEPIVLFKDGTVCRCLELAPIDVDAAAVAQTSPDDVSRWTRKGSDYVITWPGDNEPTTIDAGGERPLIYPKDQRLNGYWQRTSGAGNTAFGGDISVAVSNGFRFFNNGTFSTSNTAASTAPGVVVGSTGGEGGRYSIGADGLLALTYDNGKTERTSIYHSAGTDPVLWIGGDSFVARN